MSKKRVHDWLGKKRRKLKERIYPRYKLNDLHSARKRMKEIHYVLSIGKKTDKAMIRFLTSSENIIGEWHDHILLVDHLKRSAAKHAILIKKIQSNNRSLLRRVRHEISVYYGEHKY
jgi:CHAD domain-containing protein